MKLVIHPAADIFPIMPDYEIKEMAKSISTMGLREKIGVIQNPDNLEELLVVDGRNRLTALRQMKVNEDVIIKEYTQTLDLSALHATPEEYVMMANIERRNLTQKQRRDLAGKLAIMFEERQKTQPKEQKEDSLQKAADAAGVSRRTAATAKAQVFKMAEKGKPTPSLKDKPEAKKKEPHVSAKTILTRQEADLVALKNFGPTYSVESLTTIADFASQMAEMARKHIIGVAAAAEARVKAIQAKAAEAQAALDAEEEEGDDAA